MRIYSFSYFLEQDKQLSGTSMFDCRDLPDPEGLSVGKNGTDRAVQDYVLGNEKAALIMTSAFMELKRGNNVAVGCFAGKNRSVAMACWLDHMAKKNGIRIDSLEHRGLAHWQ